MTTKVKTLLTVAAMLCALLALCKNTAQAQINWPQNQLLPSFPTTATNQDLFTLNEKSWRWEGEGASLSHHTGRLETDGWLCQTGIDAANQHMIFGPYDTSLTAGPNVAEFRMKIDNNTANNDSVVDIDVRDAATGATLAFQAVTRQQFTVASNYTSFNLPFTMPVDHHPIELRVFWRGAAYIKVDYVAVRQDNTAEMYLFSSLKGVVNRTRPRIFSYEGDAFAEGPYAWPQSLGLTWTEYANRWDLVTKYKSEISGLIVYDPAQIHTVNLATTLSKDKKALVVSPTLLSRLTAAPYNFPVLVDLRNQFTSKLQVYQTLYNTYWPSIDHRMLIGLSPDAHRAGLREYAAALGAAVIWLDPNVAAESTLLNSFLSSMPPSATFMGWWPEEGSGITRASSYGIATVASDYSTNLTVHSGMSRTVNVKPIPAKPTLQNKIYVAFILSDGDNLQYVEHLMRKLWANPDRGSVPMGWTLSPAMLDAMPGALNYFHQSSTDNDNLISGPSGYGYAYPNNFPNATSLDQYVAKTEDYTKRAGFKVVTVWNTITGGINQNVGEAFAANAPSLLGLTAQNTGGPLTVYSNSLPGQPLSCNYCTGEQAMEDAIASASSGWNGTSPRFVIIQAQPWTDVKPTNFKNVMNSLDANHIVVRPDHLFQLMREANGLPVNPGVSYGTDITDLGGTVSAQYQTGSPAGEEYTNLTDNNANTKYLTFNASGWIQYQASTNYVVKSYTITSANDSPERDPLNWTLQGSTNGSTWTTIDTRTNQDFPHRFQKRIFNFTNTAAYNYYRFNLTNNSGTILQLAEIELFGQAPGSGARIGNIIAAKATDSVKVTTDAKAVSIYPNPANNRLYIKGLLQPTQLEVYNNNGQRMLSAKGTSVDVGKLTPGMYFLKIRDGQKTKSYKFIKQ
ncbi:T9SS type A sorting domain-containing protein [Deminuibacter soli]|uniref:T9SS C-terminal target domain-containing protein n=1 Tax=Deminuibacter soli TaxID=2291815 RepID=A0A3E1NFK1_9BACT|nr:T9SS type A sorting domain-containing protein [Deminuibacter soli]RFM26753.1 T9SS C-terminal target domain-containing protein [Deminuibacter soli]